MGTAGAAFKICSYFLVPYAIGLLLSAYVFPNDAVVASTATATKQATTTGNIKNLKPVQIPALETDPFSGLKIRLHRNGETDACGETVISGEDMEIAKAMRSSAAFVPTFSPEARPSTNKYSVDAILTHAISSKLMAKDSCGIAPNPEPSNRRTAKIWDMWYHGASTRPWDSEFLKFCDMGDERTTIQTDHEKLVKIPASVENTNAVSYPCHFHTREGVRVTSFEQLADLARLKKSSCANDDYASCSAEPTLDLYAVQAGRVFMFATSYVGETFKLPHITNPQGRKIVLETLSLSPRVFDIHDFFTGEESDAIVDKALTETAETHKLKRSTTGASGRNVIATRTSENAFDTHSKNAQAVKRRSLTTLGFDQYEEGVTDGLQVLRYSKTNGYIPHMDYIEDVAKREQHDYESMLLGSNRFATILLYFTDMPEGAGGETVFVHGWPTNNTDNRIQLSEAMTEANELGLTTMFNKGSWEEKMVAQCRSRLSVTPSRAKSVLFYSQHPDGQADPASQHGGCPVLAGTKWAANLWVWNAPRGGFEGAPLNEWAKKEGAKSTDNEEGAYAQLQATFTNTGKDPKYDEAEIFFQDTFWAKLGKGSPTAKVNTFSGHEWNVKVGGKVVKQWKIKPDEKLQQFRL